MNDITLWRHVLEAEEVIDIFFTGLSKYKNHTRQQLFFQMKQTHGVLSVANGVGTNIIQMVTDGTTTLNKLAVTGTLTAPTISDFEARILALEDAGGGGGGGSSIYDYSTNTIASMKVAVTAAGGQTNTHYGETMTFIAGADVKVGRVVSLIHNTDDNEVLKVRHLDGSEADETEVVVPIGITQSDASAGSAVVVCVRGITSAVAQNSASSGTGSSNLQRGSAVLTYQGSSSADDGKVVVNASATGNEGRVGFVCQGDTVSADGSVLIYVDCWYQGY